VVTLLQDYITINAKKNPKKTFIKDHNAEINFEEMEAESNRLSHYLVANGLKRLDRVAILIPKSILLFHILISTLKADAIYVPLNNQAPTKRNKYIVEQAKCRLIICSNETFAEALKLVHADKEKNLTVLNIDDIDFSNYPEICRLYKNEAEDLAYILFTSGSTGQPKGAMISHKNVINYTEWIVNYFQLNSSDRLSNVPGLHFDLSVFDIFSSFKSGASLHLVPEKILKFPIKIIEFIEKEKLTIWNAVPSLYTFMAHTKVLDKKRLKSLRALTFNGEVMPTGTLMSWMSACPNARFINQYGPTEATCATLFYEIETTPLDASVPLPIGKPIDGTSVFALKEDNSLAEIDEIGELYILGKGLGKGYIFDEEKTKSSFMLNPIDLESKTVVYKTGDLVKLRHDGNYDFIGRNDQQIKFMGYRIELGEIETVINSLNYVTTSAVLTKDNDHGKVVSIVAFIVSPQIINHKVLNIDLNNILPSYMIPKEIIQLKELPINANGKIDRLSLKNVFLPNK